MEVKYYVFPAIIFLGSMLTLFATLAVFLDSVGFFGFPKSFYIAIIQRRVDESVGLGIGMRYFDYITAGLFIIAAGVGLNTILSLLKKWEEPTILLSVDR